MNKKVKNAKRAVVKNYRVAQNAMKDFVKLAENASLVIVSAYAFWAAYHHEFAVEWFSYIIMAAAVTVALIAAGTFFERYKED